MRLGTVSWCEGCLSVGGNFFPVFIPALLQLLTVFVLLYIFTTGFLSLDVCCLDTYSWFWLKFEYLNGIVAVWFTSLPVGYFIVFVALFVFRPVCLFLCCGSQKAT